MGSIKKMCAILAAAGKRVVNVPKGHVLPGRGFGPDDVGNVPFSFGHGDFGRASFYDGAPDPPGVITTNYKKPKRAKIKPAKRIKLKPAKRSELRKAAKESKRERRKRLEAQLADLEALLEERRR